MIHLCKRGKLIELEILQVIAESHGQTTHLEETMKSSPRILCKRITFASSLMPQTL